MNLPNSVLSALRWSASARLASQIITWAMTLVVIRILAPTDYGLLAMATAVITFLVMLAEFGLGTALVQAKEVDTAMLRNAFGLVLSIDFALTAILVLGAPLIAAFFDEPRLVPIIRVLAIQFVVAAFSVIPDALLQRRMVFRGKSLLDLASAVLGGIASLSLALAGLGVWALVAGMLLSQTVKTVGINIISPFAHLPGFSPKGMRSLLLFGGHVTIVQVVWTFVSQLDVIIGGRWLGKEVLGLYSVAMHLASLPNQKISGLINQVAFPAFARIQEDMKQVRKQLLLVFRLLSFFAFPVGWGISSIAPEIGGVLLGPKWASMILPLQLLALIMPTRMVSMVVPTAVQGIGRADLLLGNVFLAAVIVPLGLGIGVASAGLIGMCIAWLVVSPLMLVIGAARCLPALGLTLRKLLAAMGPAALCSALMYVVVAGTRYLFGLEPALLTMLMLIAVGAVAYAASSLAFNRAGVGEVKYMLRRMTSVDSDKSGEADR